jgi:hypothetical protein
MPSVCGPPDIAGDVLKRQPGSDDHSTLHRTFEILYTRRQRFQPFSFPHMEHILAEIVLIHHDTAF